MFTSFSLHETQWVTVGDERNMLIQALVGVDNDISSYCNSCVSVSDPTDLISRMKSLIRISTLRSIIFE